MQKTSFGKAFIDQTKSLTKGKENNAEIIWRSLEGQYSLQNARSFCIQFLQSLLEKKDKKLQFLEQNEQRFLATLLCVAFFKDKSEKSADIFQQEKILMNNPKYKIEGYGIFIIYTFLKKIEEVDFPQHLISRWILFQKKTKIDKKTSISYQITEAQKYAKKVSKRQSKKYYSCLKRVSFPEPFCIEMKRLCFSYECLIEYFRSNNSEIRRSVFQHVLEALKAHQCQLGTTHKSEPYFIQLLYIIQILITYYGCSEKDIIKIMIYHCQYIVKYPSILGKMAKQTCEILRRQLNCAGKTFRLEIIKDFPCLNFRQAKKLHKDFYLISNTDDVFSCGSESSIMNMRKMIIYGIVRGCRIIIEEEEKFLEVISSLNSQQTYGYYEAVKLIVHSAPNSDKGEKGIEQEYENRLKQVLNSMISNIEEKKSKISIQDKKEFDSMISKMNSLGIFPYPELQITHIPIHQFINEESLLSFNQIELKCKEGFRPCFSKNGLPLAIYGNDQDFAQILPTIGRYLEKNSVGKGRPIKLYCIPKPNGSFSIAKYIASRDMWYNCFLYQPLKQKMFIPHLQMRKENKNLFPIYINNKIIHTYLREAKRSIKIRIYQCYLKEQGKKQQTQVLFCSNILLGLAAKAEILKQKTEKQNKQKALKYEKNDKMFLRSIEQKVETYRLSLQGDMLDELINQQIPFSEKNILVEDLSICNLPYDYFMGKKKPNPSSSTLQMAMLIQNNGKNFKQAIGNQKQFEKMAKQDRQEELIPIFQDFFTNLTIKNVKIKNLQKDPLDIIIDGKRYIKIEEIRVQPLVNIHDNNPVELDVRCFVPQ